MRDQLPWCQHPEHEAIQIVLGPPAQAKGPPPSSRVGKGGQKRQSKTGPQGALRARLAPALRAVRNVVSRYGT